MQLAGWGRTGGGHCVRQPAATAAASPDTAPAHPASTGMSRTAAAHSPADGRSSGACAHIRSSSAAGAGQRRRAAPASGRSRGSARAGGLRPVRSHQMTRAALKMSALSE